MAGKHAREASIKNNKRKQQNNRV